MEYKQLGETGIRLSAITFGAWAIGPWETGAVSQSDAIISLRKAYDLGATSIDTAAGYGLGYSEETVAEAIADIPRDKLQILTKCGSVWEGNEGKGMKTVRKDYTGRLHYGAIDMYRYTAKESIMKECESSLKRLKTDYIDHYSIHFHDMSTPIEEPMEAFTRLIEQGKIRAAGLCNHPMEQIQRARAVFPLSSNKVRYSMLNRGIENDLVPYSLENDMGIFAYCVLQRGILTGNDIRPFIWGVGENPREAYLYKPGNKKPIRAFLDKLAIIAQDKQVTLSQLCIRWTLDRPGITIALLGATTPEQVTHDVKALDITITEQENKMIDTMLDELEDQLDLEAVPFRMERSGSVIFG